LGSETLCTSAVVGLLVVDGLVAVHAIDLVEFQDAGQAVVADMGIGQSTSRHQLVALRWLERSESHRAVSTVRDGLSTLDTLGSASLAEDDATSRLAVPHCGDLGVVGVGIFIVIGSIRFVMTGRFLAVVALNDTFGVSNKAAAVNEIGQTDILESAADI
jgi:hypothetical protein